MTRWVQWGVFHSWQAAADAVADLWRGPHRLRRRGDLIEVLVLREERPHAP